MASTPGSGTPDDGPAELSPVGWFALAIVAALSLPLFYVLAPLGLPLIELPDRSAPSAYTAEAVWPYPNALITAIVLVGGMRALLLRRDRHRLLPPLGLSALGVLAGHAWYLWWGIAARTPEAGLVPLLTILLGSIAMGVLAVVGVADTRAGADPSLRG